MTTDEMRHQSHYEGQSVQPIELMLAALTREEMIGFLRGNIIKYRMRAGLKPGTDDMAKVEVYRGWLDEYVRTGTISQFTTR